MRRKYPPALGFLLMFVLLTGVSCKKKEAPPAPPPPPPPAAPPSPTVSLSATPTTIERGQSTTLEWSSTNATTLALEPALGMVPPKGTMTVSPRDSLTYTLNAKGPGGEAQASVRVTVTVPPPPPAPKPVEEDIAASFAARVGDVYFDYDKYDIRSDAVPVLQANADWLRAHPNTSIVVEGHCDERGSAEYNLGLGDRRANSTRDYLMSLGIGGDRIRTISYGKERPQCTESNEDCWQRNRRGHFGLAR